MGLPLRIVLDFALKYKGMNISSLDILYSNTNKNLRDIERDLPGSSEKFLLFPLDKTVSLNEDFSKFLLYNTLEEEIFLYIKV